MGWITQHGVSDEAATATVGDGAHSGWQAASALLGHVLYELHHLLPPPLHLCARHTSPCSVGENLNLHTATEAARCTLPPHETQHAFQLPRRPALQPPLCTSRRSSTDAPGSHVQE